MRERLRRLTFLACLVVLSARVLASSDVAAGPTTEPSVLRYLETGGLAAVLVVVLWSYRRDWARLVETEKRRYDQERERTAALADLVERAAVSQTQLVEAIRGCALNQR